MSAQHLPMLARAFGVTLTDYHRPSEGLLVGSGCGLMMAAMDSCPRFRWCFDIDAAPGADIARFLPMAAVLVDQVAICGWFSITDPEPLRRGVARMHRPAIVYAGNLRLGVGTEASTLDEFFRLVETPAGA